MLKRLRLPLVAIGALALAGAALAATAASLTIGSIGGQPVTKGKVSGALSGVVPVQGSAALATAGDETPQPRPLVADAGDSQFVATGATATLLGAGFGGAEPYTFSWSAASGELVGADSATAQISGLAAGTHTVTLSVRDQAGATATDTVKVVVYQPQQKTLLDKTHLEPTPGALSTGVPGIVKFPFTVPAGATRIDATLTHLVPTNDWDLALVDTQGQQRAFGGEFVPNTREVASVDGPEPGGWRADVQKFVTVADELRLVVTALVAPGGDPRPGVVSGGPYRFATGDPQTLRATVSGGAAPVQVAWDTDGDGVFEAAGAEIETDLAAGRHLVTVKATDANGLERRETTSVLVADPARLALETTPVTVIAIADTGINPYHLEFSAQTYPDPDVLALTANFTRHPSEYIAGYPQDAQALPVTLGNGYYPAADQPVWTGNQTIQPGKTYWIPGTKIVGAIDAGGSTGVTSGDDTHPILDDNGHGSGSASVSAGNRYGYCPTCLLFVVEALDASVAAARPWVDISSNSFGTVGGAPIGLVLGGDQPTRAAVERGQTVLFAAGNGVGNAFDVPQLAWGQTSVGPDWNVVVGAIRRDNQRAIVGDAIPVHISAWGDGNLPSACRTGTVGQCAFGGTSAATPYTAGVFGTVLTEVRRALGDAQNGQRAGQVVAEGLPIDESVYLADGKLTRAELRDAVLRTAVPLNQRNDVSPFPYPLTAPYIGEANVLFEGWGAATPESAERAVDVLLGRAVLPERPFEEDFFALDRQVRDTLYGGYDRDGDGTRDSEALSGLAITPQSVSTLDGTLAALRSAAALKAGGLDQTLGSSSISYYLHRVVSAAPGVTGCGATINESYMDREDTAGDLEPCFENRATSVAAAYRPLGLFASKDTLDAPLPAGSQVSVDLYIAGETPSVIRPTGVLMATDREIGEGAGPLLPVVGTGVGGVGCAALGEACWTRYQFAFETTRPAFTGEQLTFQVQLIGARSWAFGYEGAHASKIEIAPAAVPPTGHDLAVTIEEPADGSRHSGDVVAGGTVSFPDEGEDPAGAGGHPRTKQVVVSLDDESFGQPVKAAFDEASGTWSVNLGALELGEHTLYAKATVDTTSSAVVSTTFTVTENAVVEWQVVRRNAAPAADAWRPATGIRDWTFSFDTGAYESGSHSVVVRLLQGVERAETARASASVTLKR